MISGPTIAIDEELESELGKSAAVLKNLDNSQLGTILTNQNVDLILLEIQNDNPAEIELIEDIKSQFPDIEIILIDGNGDREVIGQAFVHGVKDAFRKPYKSALIAERLNELFAYPDRPFNTSGLTSYD